MESRVEEVGVQIAVTAAISSLIAYAGIIIVPFIVMVIMMIIDYVTGMVNAWLKKELSSEIGIRGIIKKVGYMALIAVAMGADYLIGSGLAAAAAPVEYKVGLGILVTVWLTINEMISILENLRKLEVPLPGFFTWFIERLHDNFGKKPSKNKNKNEEEDKNV